MLCHSGGEQSNLTVEGIKASGREDQGARTGRRKGRTRIAEGA